MINLLKNIRDWFKGLFEEKEEIPEIENEDKYQYRNFDDVYNMFINEVKSEEERELKKIRETTPMHIQNCNNCIGCKNHTKEGGIVYCCPKWIPKNY